MKRILLLVLSLILILQSTFSNFVFAEAIQDNAEITATEIPESIKILAIGNSFSDDATQMLYDVLRDLGVKDIIIGNLYIGGCSLATHHKHATSGANAYTYYKGTAETKGVMTAQEGKKSLLYGLTDEEWDYISMQQASPSSGLSFTYETYLSELIDFVLKNKTNPDAKLIWHMTWAYQEDSLHDNFPTYGKSQEIMYNAIVRATKLSILPRSEFASVIPAGTAVQNMRTSTVGDTLTRDGHHMSYTLGRYLTSVMWAKTLLGCDLSALATLPEGVKKEDLPLVTESVNNAYEKPFEVTLSSFTSPEVIALRESKSPFKIIDATEYGSYNEEGKTFTFTNGVTATDGAKIVYLPDAAIGIDYGACCYVDGVFYAPENVVGAINGIIPYEKFSGEIVDCTIETKTDNGKMFATLIIKNHLKEESLKGVARFRNEEISSVVGDVTIPEIRGGEAGKVVVELPLNLKDAYGTDISYDYSAQYGTYSCNAMRYFAFINKTGEVNIDGVISDGEWDNALKLVLDENSTYEMKEWTGPDDLSAVAYIAYDSKSIYVAAKVTDDITRPHIHTAWLNGDSIQFDLYLDEEKGHFTPGNLTTYTEIGSSHGRMLPGVHRYKTNTGKLDRANIDNAHVAITRGENSVTYEMIVDWKDMFGVDFTPSPDNAIGFTFVVNEKDVASSDGWLKFADGANGNGKRDANKFAQLYFLGTDKEDAVNDGSIVIDGVKYALFRRTFTARGAEIGWDATASVATATKGDITVSATIGTEEIVVNGVAKPISGTVKYINYRTYIPAVDADNLFVE